MEMVEAHARALMRRYAIAEIRVPMLERVQLYQRTTGETSDIVEKQMGQMAEQAKPLIERSLPPGPRRHEIVATFSKKFLARANSEGLIQQVIPVYDKYLTDDDVKAVLPAALGHRLALGPEAEAEGIEPSSNTLTRGVFPLTSSAVW